MVWKALIPVGGFLGKTPGTPTPGGLKTGNARMGLGLPEKGANI